MNNIVHATAIAIDTHGVLLLGPSGAGKSDLALRLIDRGATLISDDAVAVDAIDGLPWLAPIATIAGRIEVRGVGICPMANVKGAFLRLAVDLVKSVERMPIAALTKIDRFHVPLFELLPFEISATIKLELALRTIVDEDLWPTVTGSSVFGKRQ